MQELYKLTSSLLSLSFIWFFNDVTVWNWFSMLVESIIQMIAVITLMISRSFLKFMMFSLHCIIFYSIFHLRHINKMCLIDIWSLLHLHVIVATLSTHLLYKNWLKSIFLMRSYINNALWDFVWFLCNHRYWCVIFDVRYQKWAVLNLFFQIILHVYLICFCMSVNLVITSMHWHSISNKDKLYASLIILFIALFSSTSACLVTQCNFSMTSQD